jgi:hypothetical protein
MERSEPGADAPAERFARLVQHSPDLILVIDTGNFQASRANAPIVA